ncbi:hypothetical protein HZC35_03375 [Candidatus Saganbacteria bacterium]|nr:hypothetical protein [Candidatus Saganbacteria bacterium]
MSRHERERGNMMKGKTGLALLGLIILLGVLGLVGGCSTLYDEVSYQAPNWTPEGLIYCAKIVTQYRKEPMGTITLGTNYYYVTMDTDGNNETTLPYNSYPYYSPKGTYAALINGNKISIIRRSDNQEIYNFSPTIKTINELDWGPEENKLVYLKSNGDINIIDINGNNDLNLASSGETVSWKYGDNIAFQYLDGLYTPLAIIRYDGSNRINIWSEGVSSPCISNLATNEVYGSHATEYGYTDVNVNPPKYNQIFADFSGSSPKANLNKRKIVYSNYGGGIWAIDIDGTNIKQLK